MSLTSPDAEERAFLQAILAEPSSDEPRLLFADWLEEQGDPRGEFVRTQCEYARRYAANPRDPQVEQLYKRQGSLLAEHRGAWVPPVWDLFGIPPTWVGFKRGFADSINVQDPDQVIGGLNELLELLPLLRRLNFTGLSFEQFSRLVAKDALRRISELTVSLSPLGVRGAEAIAGSANLSTVQVLGLTDCDLGDSGLEAIASSAALPVLRELGVNDNGLSDAGLGMLAKSRSFPSLSVLRIGSDGVRPRRHDAFTAAGVHDLIKSQSLRGLHTIHWTLGLSPRDEDCGTTEEMFDAPDARRVRLLRHVESIW